MAVIKTIKGPWADTFYDFVGLATNSLLIASPFIKQSQSQTIVKKLEESGRLSKLHFAILTDLKPDNIMSGALDVEALLDFSDSGRFSTITYLPNLHAKVYIADQRAAIITSANLTDGGLRKNFEYGLLIDDASAVGVIRNDLDQYSSLGAIVTRDALQSLQEVAEDLKFLRQEAERSVRQSFRREFEQKLQQAKVQLLSVRAEGKTTHGIFADTILYLLARGPLRTVELHPLIQQLHPDLCDDSEDRVIKGVHFGKKWKHFVRTAQVHLKRKGLIHLDGAYWRVSGPIGSLPRIRRR